ncbi:phosphatase 2C-like domain-containing protein [Mycena sp. CBHHK59/15]|nr:phosphatase 2C-like domain-containing protein [Mycena sp. CBHHK59/15]
MDSARTIETMAETLPLGIHVHRAELQTKNEDRSCVLRFEHGTILAIFDGHHTSELSDFASKTLPLMLSHRIREDVDVEAVMKDTIEEFDSSLLAEVTRLFNPGEDFSDPRWLDRDENIHPVIGGYTKEEPQFKAGRRAVVGTTALIAFIDKEATRIWVTSLGDSDAGAVFYILDSDHGSPRAVLGRQKDGKWTSTLLSARHNCSNPEEVERLSREHPNEQNLVVWGRVSGALAVTRALGDHQLKAPRLLASRVLMYFYPSPIPPLMFEKWERDGQRTPPYLSSSPTIVSHDISPGDVFVLASDGLRDSLKAPDEDKLDVIIALATGGDHAQLTHRCIPAKDTDNIAERVIQNTLFGTDPEKMAMQLDKTCVRDDISVVVVKFA